MSEHDALSRRMHVVLDDVQAPDAWRNALGRLDGAPPPPPNHSRRHLTTATILVATLVVVGLVLYSLQGLGHSQQVGAALAPGEIVRYQLADAPQPISVGEGAAWVSVGNGVVRIDAATGEQQNVIDMPGSGWTAVGGGYAWLLCNPDDCSATHPEVLRLDPTTGRTLGSTTLPGSAAQIVGTADGAWITTDVGVSFVASDGSIKKTFDVKHPNLVGVDGDSLWVSRTGEIVSLDPNTGEVRAEVQVGDVCTMEVADNTVWVATCKGGFPDGVVNDRLTGVDATTGQVLFDEPIEGDGQMRYADGVLWLAEHSPQHENQLRVLAFDPRSGASLGVPVTVPRDPNPPTTYVTGGMFPPAVFFAIGEGSLWMTDFGTGQVIRVGMPNVEASQAPDVSVGPTSSPPPTASPPAGQDTVSESVMIAKYTGVRCTASVPSVVQPGQPLGLAITLENVSDTPRQDVPFSGTSFPYRVTDGAGVTWNTEDFMGHSWPGTIEQKPFAPGDSKQADLEPLAVQFPGPLTAKPTCLGQQMPPLHVDVADPGATPTPQQAVARAVAASSGLFDGCAPGTTGSVVGTVSPPGDLTHSMDVRCEALVSNEQGFTVVTLVMGTPSSDPLPTVPAGLLSRIDVGHGAANWEALAWRFVVTPTGAFPVASAMEAISAGTDVMYPEYEISQNGWHGGGGTRCGGDESSSGGDGTTAMIAFLDVCS